MTRKANPKSLRIGFSQVWSFYFQIYGLNLNFFSRIFYKYLISLKFILKKKNMILINNLEFWCTHSKLFVKIIYIHQSNQNLLNLKEILNVLFYWFYFQKSLKIYLIKQNTNFYSGVLVKLYINYLFKLLEYSPKKILSILIMLLNKQLMLSKITISKSGPLNLNLKGYKIILKGRIENNITSMAKSLTVKKGSLKSTSLNNSIDFFFEELNTKLGICTLQIWLFYKIIN